MSVPTDGPTLHLLVITSCRRSALPRFPIDLVSCLPFGYVVYIIPGAQEDPRVQNNKAVKLLRLMRLLKLMRLVRFKRILDRWEEELYSVGAIKFGKLLGVIFLSVCLATSAAFCF